MAKKRKKPAHLSARDFAKNEPQLLDGKPVGNGLWGGVEAGQVTGKGRLAKRRANGVGVSRAGHGRPAETGRGRSASITTTAGSCLKIRHPEGATEGGAIPNQSTCTILIQAKVPPEAHRASAQNGQRKETERPKSSIHVRQATEKKAETVRKLSAQGHDRLVVWVKARGQNYKKKGKCRGSKGEKHCIACEVRIGAAKGQKKRQEQAAWHGVPGRGANL